jgi:hypothetical protein
MLLYFLDKGAFSLKNAFSALDFLKLIFEVVYSHDPTTLPMFMWCNKEGLVELREIFGCQ